MPEPITNLAPATAHKLRPHVLLLGLGNDILSDDAVGLIVAKEVRSRLTARRDIDVLESIEMGLSLLDLVVGYHDLVIVDAIQTGREPPGFVFEINEQDLKALPGGSPHFLGVFETLALGRRLGMAVPDRVKILAVEVQDPHTVSTRMTPALQRALPAIVEQVANAVLQR
ncbi:MAG: hydrogenase maturation protease [Verrucomicrobia bacterium]|nr:hydrogenase maturation protease [Verrucomicrobiota bacterium]